MGVAATYEGAPCKICGCKTRFVLDRHCVKRGRHSEQILIRAVRYFADREYACALSFKLCAENREYDRAKSAKWYAENKDTYNAQCRQKRAEQKLLDRRL